MSFLIKFIIIIIIIIIPLEAVHALLKNLLLSVINRGDNVPTYNG